MRRDPVSLKDLARELGLSISTVSRALHNKGEINAETRKAILELAEKRHYQPNPLATGLLKKKTGTLGVILPELDNYFYSTLLRGINDFALSKGYQLMTSYSGDQRNNEIQFIDRFLRSRVEGILICPAFELTDFAHYEQLIAQELPLVLCGRDCPEVSCRRVVTDDYKSSFELTRILIETGCQRIALIANLEPLSEGRLRYEGYADALRSNHLPIRNDLILHGNMNVSTTVEAVKNLLNQEVVPDAIMCNSDSVAMVVIKMLKEKGIKVPEEICVTGFGDEPFAPFLDPPLTTVSQPGYIIGMRSMEILFSMISGEISLNGKEKTVLESGIIFRGSTRR